MKSGKTLSFVDSSPVRQVHGQIVIVRESECPDFEGPQLDVLLQRCSERTETSLDGYLMPIGGNRCRVDPDSRATALRAAKEYTGLIGGVTIPPVKFGEHDEFDWYVLKVENAVFEPCAERQHECCEVRSILDILPALSEEAQCAGHVWVPVPCLHEMAPEKLEQWPYVEGLLAPVLCASEYLRFLEAHKQGDLFLTDELMLSTMEKSGIAFAGDGRLVACPEDDDDDGDDEQEESLDVIYNDRNGAADGSARRSSWSGDGFNSVHISSAHRIQMQDNFAQVQYCI